MPQSLPRPLEQSPALASLPLLLSPPRLGLVHSTHTLTPLVPSPHTTDAVASPLLPAGMSAKKEIYTYTAPWPVYGMNWSTRKDMPFRLAVGSFFEEYKNVVHIVQVCLGRGRGGRAGKMC